MEDILCSAFNLKSELNLDEIYQYDAETLEEENITLYQKTKLKRKK